MFIQYYIHAWTITPKTNTQCANQLVNFDGLSTNDAGICSAPIHSNVRNVRTHKIHRTSKDQNLNEIDIAGNCTRCSIMFNPLKSWHTLAYCQHTNGIRWPLPPESSISSHSPSQKTLGDALTSSLLPMRRVELESGWRCILELKVDLLYCVYMCIYIYI